LYSNAGQIFKKLLDFEYQVQYRQFMATQTALKYPDDYIR